MPNKVRVGSLYAYKARGWDLLSPPFGNPKNGDIVRVINKFGCPKANTMGMCYIEQLDGEFMGMADTNSLTHVTKKGKHYFMSVFDQMEFEGS